MDVLFRHLSGETEKVHKRPQLGHCAPAETGTKNLPNVCLQLYRYRNPLGFLNIPSLFSPPSLVLPPRRSRQQFPSQSWYIFTRLHGVTSQRTVILIVYCVRTREPFLRPMLCLDFAISEHHCYTLMRLTKVLTAAM
jgi:hypothetical protein